MRIQFFEFKDLNIVEISVLEAEEEFVPFTEKSKFLPGSVFSLMQNAFEISNPDYNYYDEVPYRENNIVGLRNRLQEHLVKIGSIDQAESLELFAMKQLEGIDFLNELKTFYPKWKISWENIRDQLREVYKEMIDLVDLCIDEDKILWIKGY